VRSKQSAKAAKEILGKEISRRRKKLSMSQEELSFRSGIDRSYISEIECGLKSPTLIVVIELATALGVSATKLISVLERKIQQSRS
jgi:transcriptional regulator with XRE-family HTH domain